jgi:hypothetical protein
MAENYYDDSPTPAAAATPVAPPTEEAAPKGEDSNIAILPKSFFPPEKDLTPGSVCKVRVEEVQDDSVLVSYEKDESQETEAPPMEPGMEAMPPGGGGEMAGMY